MAAPPHKPYKRSWKNLLINKQYQLRFTLFMVGLSALLISGLGWWVMRVAQSATTVAQNNIAVASEMECRDPEVAYAAARARAAKAPAVVAPTPPPASELTGDAGEPAGAATDPKATDPAAAAAAKKVAGDDAGGRTRARPVVTIDDSEMKLPPEPPRPAPPPPPSAEDVAAYHACLAKFDAQNHRFEVRKRLILFVLIGAGLVLVIGLAIYGIKMTHKVAGPLHKISLYLAKLEHDTYDPVYSLRKGDNLVDFYEHFKTAHGGLRKLQEDDVARLRAVVAEADSSGLAARSPELAAALTELKAVLARKEKSLG